MCFIYCTAPVYIYILKLLSMRCPELITESHNQSENLKTGYDRIEDKQRKIKF